MADVTHVDFAVEWNSAAVVPGTVCGFEVLAAAWSVASGFLSAARNAGHTERFAWGNADAWASDWEHPQVASTGDALNMVDNAHLVYFAGHGARELSVSLASNHFGCRAFYTNMRLGVKLLRWLVLDLCDAVTDDAPDLHDSVMRTWVTPTRGDNAHPGRALHMVCTFIGTTYPGIDAGRGAEFVVAASRGVPVSTAWLDAAFARSGTTTNRPIVVACGANGPEAIARRDNGTLADRDLGPVSAAHLAWKWRG
jgi:hypothetical protein